MNEPVIRVRTRTPVTPPVATVAKAINRPAWPNGSGVFTLGGAGDVKRQLGWVVKRDGKFVSYRRTGPGESDFKILGNSDDYGQAITRLGGIPWAQGKKVS